MNEVIDVEKLFNTINNKNVEEILKILLKEHKRRIIKSLQLIKINIELDRKKEAYNVLNFLIDEMFGDLKEKILNIFNKYS